MIKIVVKSDREKTEFSSWLKAQAHIKEHYTKTDNVKIYLLDIRHKKIISEWNTRSIFDR